MRRRAKGVVQRQGVLLFVLTLGLIFSFLCPAHSQNPPPSPPGSPPTVPGPPLAGMVCVDNPICDGNTPCTNSLPAGVTCGGPGAGQGAPCGVWADGLDTEICTTSVFAFTCTNYTGIFFCYNMNSCNCDWDLLDGWECEETGGSVGAFYVFTGCDEIL